MAGRRKLNKSEPLAIYTEKIKKLTQHQIICDVCKGMGCFKPNYGGPFKPCNSCLESGFKLVRLGGVGAYANSDK